MQPQRVTRTSAYAVCGCAGDLLLVHQIAPGPAQGHWTLPGGGIEFGEEPASAVVRECQEEVGLTPLIGDVLGVHSDTYESREGIPHHGIRLLYRATFANPSRPVPVAPHDGEIDRVGWFPRTDLPHPVTAWAVLGAELAASETAGASGAAKEVS